jgi:hypothetical protein
VLHVVGEIALGPFLQSAVPDLEAKCVFGGMRLDQPAQPRLGDLPDILCLALQPVRPCRHPPGNLVVEGDQFLAGRGPPARVDGHVLPRSAANPHHDLGRWLFPPDLFRMLPIH